ncbi:MAG: coenzyme F420-0:L-glutamate ligase [Patescibacteria group bacterium]
MIITPVKTRVLVPPKDDLLAAIQDALPKIEERSILAVTSKVVSIWQGRCVPKSECPDKDELIKKEADKYLPREFVPNRWVMHTVKYNLFIPSAGIDESNANNYYILWPHDPMGTAQKIWRWMREAYHIKNLGVIITDSHTIPLRRGTLGISLAYCGFTPIRDYRGEKDIFGRKFVIQVADIADGLAAAAVLAMGEGRETTPLAVITDIPFVHFTDTPYAPEKPSSSFEIEEKEDLYYPLFSSVPWQQGGGGE